MATLHVVIDTSSDRHLASDPVIKYKKKTEKSGKNMQTEG